MPDTVDKDTEQEPAGIVISRGSRTEATPRFWAYVWGQFEEGAPGPGKQEAKVA